MKTSYPWQVKSVIHKTKDETKTLGIDAMLASPVEENDTRTPAAPLEMHEGYSRFKGTLIVKGTKDKTVLTFNIPAVSVPYIHKKTTMVMSENLKKQDTDISDPAYTVTIKTGVLKGRTPADILLESGDNMEKLLKQKDFLEKNVGKYPANQEQIDAINSAVEAYGKGTLTKKAAPASSAVTIYESAPKNIMPLDPEGRYTVYQVSVVYDSSMNLPVEITVMNCFAPVDKTKGNEILMNQAVNKQTKSIRLTEEEWFNIIDAMKADKIMFENLTYPTQLALAQKISRDSYLASKES